MGTTSRHVLKAARAAETAASTSSAEAEWTEVISSSVVGFMDVIFEEVEEGTKALLMKRPVGCVYLRPLGAVSSTERSLEDIVGKVWGHCDEGLRS